MPILRFVTHTQTLRYITARDRLIADISHELKTPLTTLKAYHQLLFQDFTKEKGGLSLRYLQRADYQLDKLVELIHALLQVSQMNLGKIPFELEPFSLDTLLKEIAFDIQKSTKKHTIVTHLHIRKNITADAYRIEQVMTNLILNAVKYSPNGGKVEIRSHVKDTSAVVEIEDNGIGIQRRYQKKIFQRFFRIHENKGETFPGMGIGLYVSRQIVKRHNGTISVASEKGKGSVFKVVLPLTFL